MAQQPQIRDISALATEYLGMIVYDNLASSILSKRNPRGPAFGDSRVVRWLLMVVTYY